MTDWGNIVERLRKTREAYDEIERRSAVATGNEEAYYKRKRKELIERFGGDCHICGSTENLEFAHLTDTGLSGWGRGRNARVLDVMHHPKSYILLCRSCHEAFDHRADRETRKTMKAHGGEVSDEHEDEDDSAHSGKTYFD